MFRRFVWNLLVWAAAVAGSRADGESNVWSTTRTYGPEHFTPAAQDQFAREVADKAIRMLTGQERMDLFALENTALSLAASMDAASFRPEWKGMPREEIIRGRLGEKRCGALEEACLAGLETGDEDVRMAVNGLLARGLGSHVREEAWVRQLREKTEGYLQTGILAISLDEYFSLAESLAYLGNNTGRAVLLDVLQADRRPSLLAQRAILAMQAAGEPIPDEILDKLLRSSDAIVASTAFDAVPKGWTNALFVGAAQAQLERLAEKHRREGRLDGGEVQLLSVAGFACIFASREGTLPEDARETARAAARYFVQCEDRKLAESTATLFGELAGEEDEALAVSMMGSDSVMLRRSGVIGLFHCPPDVVERHLDRLRELQDAADPLTRLQVANCLQKLANAGKIPADSFVPPWEIWRVGPAAEKGGTD